MSALDKFYVSLVGDLVGCYLEFEADNEQSVREYLADKYLTKEGHWKLPWCAVYTTRPSVEFGRNGTRLIIIVADCGPLVDYKAYVFDLVRS